MEEQFPYRIPFRLVPDYRKPGREIPLDKDVFRELTTWALQGSRSGARGMLLTVERVSDGSLVNVRISQPDGEAPILREEDAMRLAWERLLSAGIRTPDWALGESVTILEKQALLYALTHGPWSPVASSVISALLKAVGVSAPSSVPGILVGAVKETFMAVKIEDFEVLQALGVGFTDAGKKLQAAKSPSSAGGADVTTGEKIDIVQASMTDAVKTLLGDDVPGLDKYIAMGVALAGMLIPLLVKDPAVPPSA